MKARSATLSGRGARTKGEGAAAGEAGAPPELRKRLPFAERRRRILDEAAAFFAEYGLTAQTRHLAEACGISQRLLYHFFPTKAALIREVYDDAILGPFKAVWLAQLRDRSQPMEARLTAFYQDYCRNRPDTPLAQALSITRPSPRGRWRPATSRPSSTS